jgi:hypothetical protein
MKTTNSFWSILSLTDAMFFFVSCSNNDDASAKAARHNANQTMSAPTYGNLRIINNTDHVFTQDLYAYNKPNQSSGINWNLWQLVTINPNSDVTLTDYESTHSNGMDLEVGADKWNRQIVGALVSDSVSGPIASDNGSFENFHKNPVPSSTSGDFYVQWGGMESVFDSTNSVRLAFKLDYTQHFEPVVNPEQSHVHTDGNTYIFKTTGTINADGLITIDIEDFLVVN